MDCQPLQTCLTQRGRHVILNPHSVYLHINMIAKKKEREGGGGGGGGSENIAASDKTLSLFVRQLIDT